MISAYGTEFSLTWSTMISATNPSIETRIIYHNYREVQRRFNFELHEDKIVWAESWQDAMQEHVQSIIEEIWENTPFSKEEIRQWAVDCGVLSDLHSIIGRFHRVRPAKVRKEPTIEETKCGEGCGKTGPCLLQAGHSGYHKFATNPAVVLPEAKLVGEFVGGLWDNLFGVTK